MRIATIVKYGCCFFSNQGYCWYLKLLLILCFIIATTWECYWMSPPWETKPKELLLLDETTIAIAIENKVHHCFKNSLPTSLKVFSPLSLNLDLSLLSFLFFSSNNFVFFFLFVPLPLLSSPFVSIFLFFLTIFFGVVGLWVLIEGLKCSRVPMI